MGLLRALFLSQGEAMGGLGRGFSAGGEFKDVEAATEVGGMGEALELAEE